MNPDTISLRLLEKAEIPAVIPLLQQLDASIPAATLSARVEAMRENNYHCLGAFFNDELIGCSGFWILHKYYVGKHLEPDNVIVLPEHQNRGLGHHMMDWLEQHAREMGCRALELNCYVGNPDGLRFWRSRGYRTLGEHMRKDL